MATTTFKMASPSVTNTLLALNNKAKAQTPVPPYEDFGGSIPSTNTYTILPKTAAPAKTAAPKTTTPTKTTAAPKAAAPKPTAAAAPPASWGSPIGGTSSWNMLNPSLRPTYSPVAAPKPAAPVQNRPVPNGVNPGQSTGVGGGPRAWGLPQGNPSAPGLPPVGGQQLPQVPMMPAAPPQQQVPEGLAQLAAMMASMSPNFSQSLALNMPFQQKLPFQLGKDFGGDNPYLTCVPGFDPLGILGQSWGG